MQAKISRYEITQKPRILGIGSLGPSTQMQLSMERNLTIEIKVRTNFAFLIKKYGMLPVVLKLHHVHLTMKQVAGHTVAFR